MTQQEIREILEIGVQLSAEQDLDRLLGRILDCVMDLARCDAGTLYLLEGDELRFKLTRNKSQTIGSLPPVPLRRENVCALALLEGRTLNIDDVYHSDIADFSGPKRYDEISGYRTRSMLVVPMRSRTGERLGVIQLINALDDRGQVTAFSPEMALVLESVASQAALTVRNVRYIRQIRELFRSFIRMLSDAIGQRTPYNASHTRHMVEYGERFLDYLNKTGLMSFDSRRREELIVSVWLHDLGKLVTPLEVMNKAARLRPEQKTAFLHRMEVIRLRTEIARLKGDLTPEAAETIAADTRAAEALVTEADTAGFQEDGTLAALDALAKRTYTDGDGAQRPWLTPEEAHMLSIRKGTLSEEERQVMEDHVRITARLLERIEFPEDLSHARFWASAHHELLNGSGYPEGLQGDQIPPEVRIITILDIFDALVASDRPYKKGMPPEKAVTILRDKAEKTGELDPALTAAFIESRCWEE